MKECLNTSPILGKACYKSHRSWTESYFYMIKKIIKIHNEISLNCRNDP